MLLWQAMIPCTCGALIARVELTEEQEPNGRQIGAEAVRRALLPPAGEESVQQEQRLGTCAVAVASLRAQQHAGSCCLWASGRPC